MRTNPLYVKAFISLFYVICILLPASCSDPYYNNAESVYVSYPHAEGKVGGSINNAEIIIFDGKGNPVYEKYVNGSSFPGVELYRGKEYYFYAIANAGRKYSPLSRSGADSMKFLYGNNDYLRDSCRNFVMTGKKYFIYERDGSLLNMELCRCMAAVEVSGDKSGLYDGVDITVDSVMLKNVPTGFSLFSNGSFATSLKDGPHISAGPDFFNDGVMLYCPENICSRDKEHSGRETYLELHASYSSAFSAGKVVYRFHPGMDTCSHFDIERNHMYRVKVFFREYGAIGENNWRVEDSSLSYFDSLTVGDYVDLGDFPGVGEDCTYSSSDKGVAYVDASGRVKGKSEGDADIIVSAGGVERLFRITVVKAEINVKTVISAGSTVRWTWKGVRPVNVLPDLHSMDTSVLKILHVDREYIILRGVKTGKSRLVVISNGRAVSYIITVV
ncbi:MAG: Ig-like domain-containing protein [Bacteroidales bacterium]|jgi:hypothetical protein|nr:Ig-like domain-containing protein [Bacteroidales bacterium]